MYLGPLLDGQCLRYYPPKVTYKISEIIKRNETSLGYRRYHRLGFHYLFTLDWGRSMITESMWTVIKDIVNKDTTITFIPFPDKYINSSFTVRVIDGLASLTPMGNIADGYRGAITLETTSPVPSVEDWEI